MHRHVIILLIGLQVLSQALYTSQQELNDGRPPTRFDATISPEIRERFREDLTLPPAVIVTSRTIDTIRPPIPPTLPTRGLPTVGPPGRLPPGPTRGLPTIGPPITAYPPGPLPPGPTRGPPITILPPRPTERPTETFTPPTEAPTPVPYNLQTTNSGNEFYLGFMENYIKPAFVNNDRLVLNRSQIFITTPESIGAVAVIESEQGRSMINVRPGEIMTRTFEDFKVTSGTDRRKGIKIKAEQLKQISVFALNEELHSTDAFTALPCAHLPSVTSYEYYAISVPAASPNAVPKSAFLVVACSDNTVVSITPTFSIGHPYIPNFKVRAGTTFNVRLNERETLYVRDSQDLTGTKVVSNNPISFFTGHECGNVPANTPECDHLVEQIPPTVTWGTQFILAPTITRESPDLIRIVASKDNTSGVISCASRSIRIVPTNTPFTLSQAGNVMDFNLSTNSFCYLETDKPVMTVQFTPGGGADRTDNADPFMVIVPAIRQYLDITKFSTVSDHDYRNHINLFVPGDYNPSGVKLVRVGLESVNLGTGWTRVPCPHNSSTCGYIKQATISDSVRILYNSNGGPVGVIVYGFSYLESYAFVGGLKMTVVGEDGVVPPRSILTVAGSSLCIGCHSAGEDLGNNPTTVWNKDGSSVIYADEGRISLSPSGALCIDDIIYSDAGRYVCHIRTQGLSYETRLMITGGIIVEPSCEISGFDGPEISVGQDTVYLDRSTSSFGICCRAEGPPDRRTNWQRNGVYLESQQGYFFGEGYLRYTGSLHNGCAKFTCEVTFIEQDITTRETTEICIGDISPPTVVNVTGRTTALEKTVATFQCSADGYPEPTRMWTAGADTDSALPSTAKDDGNGQLTVKVTYHDVSRRYCCDVSNQHGQILSKCIMINVLVVPVIATGKPSPIVTISLPYGVTWPLQQPLSATIPIGSNVMVPEGYELRIECQMLRGNPPPNIVWYLGEDLIQGPQYSVNDNGTLVITGITRDRDEGVYTCMADTPDVGQDESSTTVIVTVPPRINSSEVVSLGNCLDLTKSLVNTQPVGVNLCLRAGENAKLTLECTVVDGSPAPNVEWLKNGEMIERQGTTESREDSLIIYLPRDAYGEAKKHVEGNYTCHAFNVAGSTTMETHIAIFGDIPKAGSTRDFGRRHADMYNELHKSVSEHFPGVKDGIRHLALFTGGEVLSYEDYHPGYLYDESEESVLPQTMENMFDLVDIIPDGGSIVFNPHRASRLQQTYSQLVDMLHSAPSSLSQEEHLNTRNYFQQGVRDPASGQTLPRLSLYLQYKDTYYSTKMEVEDLIESKRRGLLGWEFTQWYERNINSLQMKIRDAYTKWEMYADKTDIEESLDLLSLEDHSHAINEAQALLLASHRMSRFKDEKEYYLVKLYPNKWYKDLRNRARESIEQMQFQLSKLRTEIRMLELTGAYLEKETREREALKKLFPSLDPVYQLRCDLDLASYQLQELVKESEDMRYECLVSGNPADCHIYWSLQEHIRHQVLGNYTEFFWYVHSVEAALDHRQFSLPAISSTIDRINSQTIHIQAAVDIALSELSGRDSDDSVDDRDFFADFMYNPNSSNQPSNYDFSLPSSLLGRLMWYINPESTRLVPKELVEEYNLTINHLNTAFTNVSAKLSRVNVHRRWFKAGMFGNKHLVLADRDILVSPGEITPPSNFRELLANDPYQLPLYPSTLLLATNIELTVDVPYTFHTLPTLIKLSYDPHVTGGFGPFSFGPLHKANAGNMKFRVGISNNKISITIPGTQLIGYVCDVVPRHPKNTFRRSTRSIPQEILVKESEFDHWLFSRKKKNRKHTHGLFHKDGHSDRQPTDIVGRTTTDDISVFITPSATTTTTIYHNNTL